METGNKPNENGATLMMSKNVDIYFDPSKFNDSCLQIPSGQ